MKKTALWKDTFREIGKTKTRFLSIFAIILLGVAFFAGISATGPVMIQTADDYYQDHDLMDFQILSTYGLNDEDKTLLESIDNATVETLVSSDVVMNETGMTSKIYGYDPDKGQSLNQYTIIEGRLPKTSGEIALDSTATYQENYKVGDKIELPSGTDDAYEDTFSQLTFEVVGFVKSPLYVESDTRGNTQAGSGTLDGFSVILEKDFDVDYYSEAFVRYDQSEQFQAYSDEYDEFIADKTTVLETLVEDRPQERLDTLQAEGQEEIDEGNAEIESAEAELEDARIELENARNELDDGWAAYEEGLSELEQKEADARSELQSKRSEIEEGKTQINDARAQLQSAQSEIDNGRAQLEAERETTEAQLTASEQEIAAGRQQLENARAELNAAEQNLQANAAQLSEEQLTASQQEIDNNRVQLAAQEQEIEQAEQAIAQGRQQLAAAEAELEQSQQQVNANLAELENRETEIVSGEQQLDEAEATLESELESGRTELADVRAELEEGEADYQEGLETFENEREEAEAEIADARTELEEAQADLDGLELPEYLINDRSYFAGYDEYGENAERIGAIAKIFPVFFFLLAALISLTTMTRMVDEGRSQIGTMKALGYKNMDISLKYFVYAFLATVLGALIGLGVGYWIFPSVIMDAYGALYNLPDIGVQFYWSYSIISIIASLCATGLATLVAVRISLQSNASNLLRPKAPKKGKRILIERRPFLWNRFSFTQKVASRNLFRYKGRMFMTIIGVAGCTALLLTGFGLSDSIANIGDIQYGEINLYQAIVSENTDADQGDQEAYEETLSGIEGLENHLRVEQNAFTAEVDNNRQDVNVFVPEDKEILKDFVVLRDKHDQEMVYDLPDEGAVITEKLAELLGISVGDTIQINGNDQEVYDVEVTGTVEHYFQHFVYLSPSAYQAATGEDPVFNTRLLKYDTTEVEDSDIGQLLNAEEAVQGVTFVSVIYDTMQGSLDSLDVVTLVIIISAATLAFIVLYNLTNINVSERERELSTIKVLGFYDREVTMYVYRENLVLTLMGIIVGLALGVIMHRFVLNTAEIDVMRFSRQINLTSYLYSGLLTFLFSGLVMILMHFKLKYIDMIEALKAQE
ncbi:ABC transporter permease [Marinilactibacillus kalidii]|uniref:ABC transporter permease n=1 Tax=Marinilactibacillus kalidii TaxID=2820274 RepID=UPI001ABDA922|nr:ABC transporter permease [Marinilactibacillus kalidii]